MPRANRALAVAGAAALLLLGACGKKAPLRLPESRPAETAPAPRAKVREGRVILEFRVPAHRVFPEREDPWVLARVLRGEESPAEPVEAGAILETEGFAFGAPLVWVDEARAPGKALVFLVEFRDALRRRRAISPPLQVLWDAVPPAPAGLLASGAERAVSLSWEEAPGVSVRYRVYRRDPAFKEEALFEEPIAAREFVDLRVGSGREYCYAVRAVLDAKGLEVEGPASPEACARTEGPPAPPPQPPK
jgi:predicted small lipoprotein YifL